MRFPPLSQGIFCSGMEFPRVQDQVRGKQGRTELVPRGRFSINHDLASEPPHGLFLPPGTLFPATHSHLTQISRQGSEVPSSEKSSLRALVRAGASFRASGPLYFSISSSGLRLPEGRDNFSSSFFPQEHRKHLLCFTE